MGDLASISSAPPRSGPWLRECGLGFVYWLALLLALEPGNVQVAGGALAWDQEAIRILGASLLGGATTPAVLVLVRRFPVQQPGLWRRVGLHVASLVCLAFILIVASCVLADWWLASEHRPLTRAIPEQLTANLLLLLFCLSVLSGLAHAAHFLRQTRAMPSGVESTILIKARGSAWLLDLAEVDWIESQGNYQALHCGSETHLVRETSQRFETRLDPVCFVRIHRRTLVARDRIVGIRRLAAGDAMLQLRDGQELRLSRGFRDGFEVLRRGR